VIASYRSGCSFFFAHPALEKSRVNRVLIDGVDSVEGVTFHDLYEAYPGLDIDVAREQALLADHDVVVMHHPFFWYSTPAILKEWQDLVLQHGWAYGADGNALRGKFLMSAVTTGGKEDAYQVDGFHGCHVRDFLLPIARTAWLCGMVWLAPFIAHGTLHMTRQEMAGHARDYRRLLGALRDGAVDLTKAADPDLAYINRDLDAVIQEATDAR
jgi:glutathione-regulated potassium-efflux system ancillary protein KefG